MSIETVSPITNSSVEFEEFIEQEDEVEATKRHPRVKFHNEIIPNVVSLDELQRRHSGLNLHLIKLAEQIGQNPTDELEKTRAVLYAEYEELAVRIDELREVQRDLILGSTACNQTIERARPKDEHDKEAIEARAKTEHPYLVHLYNDGEDHIAAKQAAKAAMERRDPDADHYYLPKAAL